MKWSVIERYANAKNLHARIDELMADAMQDRPEMMPSKTTVLELMEWSNKRLLVLEAVAASEDNEDQCATCLREFATCGATNVTWAIDRYPSLRGKAADAVLACASYIKINKEGTA